jgi:hypothetical protein
VCVCVCSVKNIVYREHMLTFMDIVYLLEIENTFYREHIL